MEEEEALAEVRLLLGLPTEITEKENET